MSEMVNHPSHYAHGNIECIDAMLSAFGVEQTMAFCKLNALKYIWRLDHKNGVEDAHKAVWYMKKYIELADEKKEKEPTADEPDGMNSQPPTPQDWRDYFTQLCKVVEPKDHRGEKGYSCEECVAWDMGEDCYPCNACCNTVVAPMTNPEYNIRPFLWQKASKADDD